jgi:CRP-like cAMP-binding protein
MPAQRSNQSLLWELQDNLSADLFASAAPLRLAADEALFLAGDSGDGCYLVEDGLLKVVVASHSGGERILFSAEVPLSAKCRLLMGGLALHPWWWCVKLH